MRIDKNVSVPRTSFMVIRCYCQSDTDAAEIHLISHAPEPDTGVANINYNDAAALNTAADAKAIQTNG